MKLLRIEGVNIYATVTDTDDLSTRRGSSLLLLQAVRDVADKFKHQLAPISTGASVGLFSVQDNPSNDLASNVRDHLHRHKHYRHMTFVVDEAQAQCFRPAAESVLAANRWQQMQSFSTALANLNQPASTAACAANQVRPADPKDKDDYSPSVRLRRDYGREQKKSFYAGELSALMETAAVETARLEALRDLDFVHDLQQLSEVKDKALTGWGFSTNLDGKMAVFYADGNRFGQIASHCVSESELKAWDEHLKTLRRQWLASLLEVARTTRHWQTRSGEIRLETLLWGGDEFMQVVPAWCALELAQHFVQASQGWVSPPIDLGDGRGKVAQPLTHACGLVMCHRNAPIGPISELAQSLADLGKRDDQRNASTVHALVLESFDNAGGDLDALLTTRFHERLNNWSALTLTPKRLATLAQYLGALKAVLPRSTLTRALRLLLQGNTSQYALLARSYASVNKAVSGSTTEAVPAAAPEISHRQTWENLWKELSGQSWTGTPPMAGEAAAAADIAAHLAAWTQLLEFWDYLADQQTQPDNAAQGAAA